MTAFKTRVAFCSSGYFPSLDGVSVSLHNRIRGLIESGRYEVLLIIPCYEQYPETFKDKPADHLDPRVSLYMASAWRIEILSPTEIVYKQSAYSSVIKRLEEFKPDILFVEEPERIAFGLGRPLLLEEAPSFALYHTRFAHYAYNGYFTDDLIPPWAGGRCLAKFVGDFFNRLVRRSYREYRKVLFANERLRAILEDEGIPSQNLYHLPFHGIETNVFRPRSKEGKSFQSVLHDPARDVNFICVSRLEPEKGWHFLIKKLKALRKEFDQLQSKGLIEWKLHIVGDGTMYHCMKSALEKHLLPNQFHMYGAILHRDVVKYLQSADVYVTCSTSETFGIANLEALACGLPIIAPFRSRLGYLEDGVNGFFYSDDGDERPKHSFSNCCVQLAADRNFRGDCSKQAALAAQVFGKEKINESFQRFIDEHV